MPFQIPDALLGILVPLLTDEGFKIIPDKVKPMVSLNFAAAYSELKKMAAGTAGSTLDDRLVEAFATEVKEYMTAKGFGGLFDQANAFVML